MGKRLAQQLLQIFIVLKVDSGGGGGVQDSAVQGGQLGKNFYVVNGRGFFLNVVRKWFDEGQRRRSRTVATSAGGVVEIALAQLSDPGCMIINNGL